MNDDLLSELGDRSISEIQPLDMLETVHKIEERGAIESAKAAIPAEIANVLKLTEPLLSNNRSR